MNAEIEHEQVEQNGSHNAMSKQTEILIKRLLLHNNMRLGSDKKMFKVDGLSRAEFNRLCWEVAIIAMEYIDEKWDYIVNGFDDPSFDWASAKVPDDIAEIIFSAALHEQAN